MSNVTSLKQQLKQEQEARKKAEQRLAEQDRLLLLANRQIEELRNQQVEQLRQFKETTDYTNKTRNDFLFSISHELRTSLDGILGYAQMLKQHDSLPPTVAEGLNVIYDNSKHLLTLVSDVLDISKAQAKKLELHPDALNLPNFMQNIAALVKVQAKQKKLEFIYRKPNSLPVYVQADEKRLRQILLNLLSNAIKFTDKGHITLSLNLIETDQPSLKKFRFAVEDSGIGMSAEQEKMIFAPFEQVSDAPRYNAGVGLGLSISWQLVDLMGSQLFVKSQAGKGSLFWFEVSLPVLKTNSAFEAAVITDQNALISKAHNADPPALSDDDLPLKAPPAYELKQLIEMVSQGRILEIQRKAEQIAQRTKDYIPFANNLRRLAKEFKEDQILNLLQAYIQD